MEKNRKTGIDILGDISWGTHFCLFYHTKEDLTDILVPYFKTGLENNEFCVWITSESLSEKEAKEAMRKIMPNFDRYLKRGQIEIIPHTEWYLKDGVFNPQKVLNAWINKFNQALIKGYDGIRITGNVAWFEKKDWKNLTDYEAMANNTIGKYRVITLCTYLIDRCEASEIIDVVSNHRFALIRREGKWELIESSEIKQTKEELLRTKNYLQNIIENSPDIITVVNMKGNITTFNKVAEEVTGYKTEEVIGTPILNFCPEKEKKRILELWKTVLEKGKVKDFETNILNRNKELIPIKLSMSLLRDDKGHPIGTIGISRDLQEIEDLKKRLEKFTKKEMNLTKNEKLVFYGIVKYPDLNDVQLSKKIGIKRSTTTLIRNRLKKRELYSVHNIPNFQALGFELLTFTFGKSNPSKLIDKRKEITKKFSNEEAGFVVSTDNEYLNIHVSKNITDFKKYMDPLIVHYTNDNGLDTTTVLFPFKLSEVLRFFDFAPFLKQDFGLNIEDEPRELKNIKKRKLTKNEKIILYALTKYPELNDGEIAKKINIHRPTVTNVKNKLIKDDFLQKIKIPNLAKFGCELLSLDYIEFGSETGSLTKTEALELIKNSPHIIFDIFGNKDCAILNIYKNYNDFKVNFNQRIKLCRQRNISIKDPTTFLFLIQDIKLQKLDFAPIVKNILGLEVTF